MASTQVLKRLGLLRLAAFNLLLRRYWIPRRGHNFALSRLFLFFFFKRGGREKKDR